MGSDPVLAMVLIGLGVEDISSSAAAIPALKKAIRSMTYKRASAWAEEAAAMSTVSEVDEFLREKAHTQLRDFLGPDHAQEEDGEEADS